MLKIETLKNTAVSFKNGVVKHKEALAVAAVTIPVIVLQQKGLQGLNGFLKEKNLFDEYYALTEVVANA